MPLNYSWYSVDRLTRNHVGDNYKEESYCYMRCTLASYLVWGNAQGDRLKHSRRWLICSVSYGWISSETWYLSISWSRAPDILQTHYLAINRNRSVGRTLLICLFDLDAPRLAPIIPGTNGLLVLPLLWILTHGNDNGPIQWNCSNISVNLVERLLLNEFEHAGIYRSAYTSSASVFSSCDGYPVTMTSFDGFWVSWKNACMDGALASFVGFVYEEQKWVARWWVVGIQWWRAMFLLLKAWRLDNSVV